MRIQPWSFLLGLGAASVLPVFSRVLRPLAVEATVAGMAIYDEARRMLAEQMENIEDIAAEARARREEMLAAVSGAATNGSGREGAGEEETAGAPRGRRRAPATSRRHPS
jgi:hypothetical protein